MNNKKSQIFIDNNLFEFKTDVGPVTIQLICLPAYVWIIVSHSKKLNIDGSLQLAMQTPYEDKPTVLNMGVDEHQANSNDLCRKLGKQLQCAVVLSMSLETETGELSIKDQRQLCKFIKVCYDNLRQSRQKQSNSQEKTTQSTELTEKVEQK